MKLSLTLLAAFAYAADYSQASAAADYSQAPAAAQDPDYNQESATQEPATEYSQVAASDEPAQYEQRPEYRKLCLGHCPAGNYCQHRETGQCHEPETEYGEYGEYGEKKVVGESCPDGTIDLTCSRTGSRIALWVAFALLFIPALRFWYLAFHSSFFSKWDKMNDGERDGFQFAFPNGIFGMRKAFLLAFMINFIASLAYLAMALGYGYTVKCCNGHRFYYARYIDWFFTTPLLLIELLHRIVETGEGSVSQAEKHFVIFANIIMIVAGLIGGLVCGKERWVFFAFAMLAFLPIWYLLCTWQFRVFNASTGLGTKASPKIDLFGHFYRNALWLLLVTWSLYPLVWILADGATNVLCARGESIFYAVLDVLAKTVFSHILTSPSSMWKKNDEKTHVGLSSIL